MRPPIVLLHTFRMECVGWRCRGKLRARPTAPTVGHAHAATAALPAATAVPPPPPSPSPPRPLRLLLHRPLRLLLHLPRHLLSAAFATATFTATVAATTLATTALASTMPTTIAAPPSPPSPPDVNFNPELIPMTRARRSQSAAPSPRPATRSSFCRLAHHCTGAVFALFTSGAIVSSARTVDITLSSLGIYKTCIAQQSNPTLTRISPILPAQCFAWWSRNRCLCRHNRRRPARSRPRRRRRRRCHRCHRHRCRRRPARRRPWRAADPAAALSTAASAAQPSATHGAAAASPPPSAPPPPPLPPPRPPFSPVGIGGSSSPCPLPSSSSS